VRVLRNSVTEHAEKLWGNHPDRLPRIVIGEEEGRPLYKFGTDSPLRSTTGDFEQMSLYAGEGAALVASIKPAAEIIATMMRDAEDALRRSQRVLG
jgi:nitronate monooxygenase